MNSDILKRLIIETAKTYRNDSASKFYADIRIGKAENDIQYTAQMSIDFLHAFAELIISECMEAVSESDPSEMMTLTEPYLTIIENIKQRTGWHDE